MINRLINVKTLSFLIIIVAGFFFSCKKDKAELPPLKLLFKSGFESGVELSEMDYGYRYITGVDAATGFSWPIDILGANPESGMHYIDDDNEQAVFSELQTVIGHDGTPTRALYNQMNYNVSGGVTQCPYEILDLKEGKHDLYIKYWMKVDSASLFQTDKWRAIFEYKTKGYAQHLGYRLIAYIYSDENGNPYWHFQGDRNPQSPIWEIDNKEIPVPVNEWFMVEYYWTWSSGKDGVSGWKVNGEIVGEHKGATTRLNRPIDFIILTQIYGDANPKHQWIDDIEIWNRKP